MKPPKYTGCMYGAMTKWPWCTKSQHDNQKLKQVNEPGACVSVDQLESSTPGFIPQLKGKLTKQCYHAMTVFVDHYSGLSYIHMQRQLTSEETLEAKNAFEAFAWCQYVKIWHYHADNGRFADTAFLEDVNNKGQMISFCGVNAHFQNGIAENVFVIYRNKQESSLYMQKCNGPQQLRSTYGQVHCTMWMRSETLFQTSLMEHLQLNDSQRQMLLPN